MPDVQIENLMETIRTTTVLLNDDPKWEGRWMRFSNELMEKKEKIISLISGKVHIPESLMLYSTISEVSSPKFDLRYLGNTVAILNFGSEPLLSTNNGNKELPNLKYYPGYPVISNVPWLDAEATKFRKFFMDKPKRTEIIGNEKIGKGQPEHRAETALIRYIKKKNIKGFKPVLLFDKINFSFPLPISASKKNELKIGDGHIDILARENIHTPSRSNLCVIEVKDENKPSESVERVLSQGLAYSVALNKILRSSSGTNWYHFLMGGDKEIPQKLKINVVAAVPYIDGADTSFGRKLLKLDSQGNDEFELHYIYYKLDTSGEVSEIVTSFFDIPE